MPEIYETDAALASTDRTMTSTPHRATVITEPIPPTHTVAYLLKGYPRMSELFIASEIWRLERQGVRVRLFVVKPADEAVRHPVVDEIAAQPSYLPSTSSLTSTTLWRWLHANLESFAPALRRVGSRHPWRLARLAATVAAESVRGRKGRRLRRIYVKEALLAVALADGIERAGDVGHVHAHFAHGATTVAWWACRLTGHPFSFTGHAKDIYEPGLNPGGLLRRKLRAAEFVTTCTGANLEHLRAIAPEANTRLLYHGLNADFSRLLDATPRRLCEHAIPGVEHGGGLGGGPRPDPRSGPCAGDGGLRRPRIVSVGRMVAKKGFDVLLDAFTTMVAAGSDAELVIAGEDGDQTATLRATVAERGLSERVRFAGVQSQEGLLALLDSADTFVLACRIVESGDRDGIPNVLMEAMAAGVPIVSSAVSGIPELVTDGVDGLLVEPESPSALAAAIGRVLADAALAARLATAAQATIATRFDGDRLVNELVSMFAEAAATAAARPR